MKELLKNKTVRYAAGFIVLAALVYVAFNGAYFLKQARFMWSKPAPSSVAGDKAPIGEPNQLSIPSLGIATPIVEPAGTDEKAYQEALKNGVVHYPGTAKVGEPGNTYIFGHSSDFALKGGNYKTVFALLPKIQNGAEIIVSNSAGEQFRYIVTEQFVANSTDVHLLDQGDRKEKKLTLQTSYPLGTALRRYIVVAKLAE